MIISKKSQALSLGVQAEALARQYLVLQGVTLVENNFRCKMGEIDIIATQGQYLLFIEVRYRTSRAYGGPLESLTWQKCARIENTAQYYLKLHSWSKRYFSRFDVIAISPKGDRITHLDFNSTQIEWLPNAFTCR